MNKIEIIGSNRDRRYQYQVLKFNSDTKSDKMNL